MRKGKTIESEKAIDKAIELGSPNTFACSMLKASCLFEANNYEAAIKILANLSRINKLSEKETLGIEVSLKATIDANKNQTAAENLNNFTTKHFDASDSLITAHRPVNKDLIAELDSIKKLRLETTKDSRYGNGYCSNFSLFSQKLPEIQNLEKDLTEIIKKSLKNNHAHSATIHL